MQHIVKCQVKFRVQGHLLSLVALLDKKNCDLDKQGYYICTIFSFSLSSFDSFELYHCANKQKGIGSIFPERGYISLCIINHFRIICSNQMNKKRCFQELYF